MRILLINPSTSKRIAVGYPPHGLLYIASILKKKGYFVEVLDNELENLDPGTLLNEMRKRRPNVVGVTMNSTKVPSAYLTAMLAKRATNGNATVVVGGPHPTVLPVQTLHECPSIDIAVLGEGEVTMLEIAESVESGRELADIKGIAFRKDNEVMITGPRPYIQDLDSLPFPAYDIVPVRRYFSMQLVPSLFVMASRGCPFKCIFCSNPIWGRRVRNRNPKNVVDEIEWLVKKYKVREIHFIDDNFNLRPKIAEEICDELIGRGLHRKIIWRAQFRANRNLTPRRLFKKMKEAGCWQIYFGVESGNQKILSRIMKGITLDEVRRAFGLTKEAGIETGGFFMIGNLGEDMETIWDTISFMKELSPDVCDFNIATPYPGSEFFEILKQNGTLPEINWNTINDQVLKAGTFTFGTEELSSKELRKMLKVAYKKFYLRPAFALNRIWKLVKSPLKPIKEIHRSLGELKGAVETRLIV